MSKIIEDMKEEVARETTKKVRYENATNMLRDSDLTLEQIAAYSNLSFEEVLALAESIS